MRYHLVQSEEIFYAYENIYKAFLPSLNPQNIFTNGTDKYVYDKIKKIAHKL